MEAIGLRVIGAGLLGILLAAGSWLAGKQERDSARRVEALRDGRAIQEQALEDPAHVAARDARAYQAGVMEDAARFEIDAFDIEILYEPNTHAIELRDAEVLQPGQSWSSKHLTVRAKREKVTYQQHGATIAASHVVAEIENVGDVAVAYNLRVRSKERGRCDVRGLRTHNAVALAVGEKASIVVCAGRGAISLEHVEILELSPLGYHFVSAVPAEALGIDPVTAQAHRPPASSPSCDALDVQSLSATLRDGRARWVDVADFYSRHNCTRWQYVPAYRHATARLPHLPVTR